MPERPETAPFLDLVDQTGLLRRRLRRVARPDLATAISIHQFIFVPAQPAPAQCVTLSSGSPTGAKASKVRTTHELITCTSASHVNAQAAGRSVEASAGCSGAHTEENAGCV